MEISDDPFAGDRYIIQGGVGTALAFFGVSTPSYRVFDEQGRLVLAAEVPALSAREIVLYADEKMLEPVLALVQRNRGNTSCLSAGLRRLSRSFGGQSGAPPILRVRRPPTG